LNEVLAGRLSAVYAEREKENHVLLELPGVLACPRVYVVNFHVEDLPFSYHSVDQYGRTIVRVGASGGLGAGDPPTSVATAIHGPGAGLDACEAMETLIQAFAHELRTLGPVCRLQEVILVESDKAVFQRLQERLKYLVRRGIVMLERGTYFVNPVAVPVANAPEEIRRIDRLELKHLFIAMPYAKAFSNVYYFGIKLPVEQRGRKCERVDQAAFTGDIVDRVKMRIASSEVVIADITGDNPNVFFEVAYVLIVHSAFSSVNVSQEPGWYPSIGVPGSGRRAWMTSPPRFSAQA
jgi:hypothetical protein